MSSITKRIQNVRQRIAKAASNAQRNVEDVTLLAVSKKQPASAIEVAFSQGLRCFGESYVTEALEKIEQLTSLDIEWHFIGPIQSNKTASIAEHFDWVQSVDRLKIAQRLNDQRPDHLAPLNVCIQINIDNEPSKSGIRLDELDDIANAINAMPRLRLRGLMCLPAKHSEFNAQRVAFHTLKQQFIVLQNKGLELDTLSMGMSYDLEAAIAEGATIVRIGTALFGPRD